MSAGTSEATYVTSSAIGKVVLITATIHSYHCRLMNKLHVLPMDLIQAPDH